MCQDTSKLWSVLELPPSDLRPGNPSSSRIQAPLEVRSAPARALLQSSAPAPCLSAASQPPDCPLLRGAPAPPTLLLGSRYRDAFSDSHMQGGPQQRLSQVENKTERFLLKSQENFFPPFFYCLSLNLSWCFFLFLHYLTSRSFGHGDTHLWGECRPPSTCSSTCTGVWAANM